MLREIPFHQPGNQINQQARVYPVLTDGSLADSRLFGDKSDHSRQFILNLVVLIQ